MKRCIRFEAVHFSYGTGRPVVLEGVDLDIRKGDRIGIIGTTGSGKSTAIDLLMGLLVPTAGAISIDGENLHAPEHPERLLAWRASIGNVPQNIYLSDSSILENIAFGVPTDQIDFPRVRQVAKEAQVASFIESTPYGYATKVGERGISLSGGQRQRLGIARALYKRPKILVFDEATSALDGETESAVIQAIEKLDKQITIVMIAHRVSTLQKCQKIFEIVDGHILLLEGGGSGLNAEKFIPFGMKA
jgi:ATP-binding cassette subfamily B protein